MILRANRLVSEAWLLPGREIIVPEGDFCRRDAGVCPVLLLNRPAGEKAARYVRVRPKESAGELASRAGTAAETIAVRLMPGARAPVSDEAKMGIHYHID